MASPLVREPRGQKHGTQDLNPNIVAVVLTGETHAQRPGALGLTPAPSLAVQRGMWPPVPQFPHGTVAVHPALPRCHEDPKTEHASKSSANPEGLPLKT